MIEEDLLNGFIKGQKHAFDEIYTAYAPGMYGLCLRYTRCEDDAKDVLQESFIKIYQSRENFNVNLSLGAWIKTITIRTALNYIKENYRMILSDDEKRFERSIFDEENPAGHDTELKEKLLRILQQLPDGYRTVFNLYTIDNLTHKEIADYLDITEGTSKSQYFKAKKMIHSLLESEKIER